MKADDKSDYEEFRPFQLYMMLGCGIIVILAGLYLLISNSSAQGIALPTKLGMGGGNRISLSGMGAIVIGVGLSVFPVYQLIRRKKNKW